MTIGMRTALFEPPPSLSRVDRLFPSQTTTRSSRSTRSSSGISPGAALNRLTVVIAAVRGKAEALPAAEGLAAKNQQRCARSEVCGLLEQGVEHVDLRSALLDRLNRLLDFGCIAARALLRLERFLKLFDRLFDVREEGDGLDVRLHALTGGLELLVDSLPHVFDGRADFAYQFLNGFADVRVNCARDVVAAPHRHKFSRCCNLLESNAAAIISHSYCATFDGSAPVPHLYGDPHRLLRRLEEHRQLLRVGPGARPKESRAIGESHAPTETGVRRYARRVRHAASDAWSGARGLSPRPT